MIEERIGTIEHYYPKVHAAAVHLEGDLQVGDKVHIVGTRDDLVERVESLQIDHEPVNEGHRGDSVGLQVSEPVHENADVYVIRG